MGRCFGQKRRKISRSNNIAPISANLRLFSPAQPKFGVCSTPEGDEYPAPELGSASTGKASPSHPLGGGWKKEDDTKKPSCGLWEVKEGHTDNIIKRMVILSEKNPNFYLKITTPKPGYVV